MSALSDDFKCVETLVLGLDVAALYARMVGVREHTAFDDKKPSGQWTLSNVITHIRKRRPESNRKYFMAACMSPVNYKG